MKVKIFQNSRGEPEKFQSEINEWLGLKNIKIQSIQYSTDYDSGIDEYVLNALILYED